MAEVVKQFGFNGTTEEARKEGWAYTAGGASNLAQEAVSSASDSPNDSETANPGFLRTRRTKKESSNGTPYAEWAGTLESLGVPAGATVTAVNLSYDWKNDIGSSGNKGIYGPAELRDSGGSLLKTFSTSFENATEGTAWATKAGTNQTGLSLAANTSIRLRLGINPVCPSTKNGEWWSLVDWVVVSITYSEAAGKTVEGKAALTGTGSLSAKGVRQASTKASLSGTGALTSKGLREATGKAALTGTGSLTAKANLDRFGKASLPATGSLSASGVREASGRASMAATGTLSAVGVRIAITGANLTGTGSLSASGLRTSIGTAALTGTGSLSASGNKVVGEGEGSAALTGTGSLAASGIVTRQGAANLSGTGSLQASGLRISDGKASLVATGTLGASAIRISSTGASLTGTGSLTAAGQSVGLRLGTVSLTAIGSLTARGVVGEWAYEAPPGSSYAGEDPTRYPADPDWTYDAEDTFTYA